MSDAQANEGDRSVTPGPSSPIRIGLRDPSKLVFDWADGTTSEATAAVVRRGCACAICVDENTGRPLLDPASVPDDLTHSQVDLVGLYALTIRFSDGHGTGIFPWKPLRRLTEA